MPVIQALTWKPCKKADQGRQRWAAKVSWMKEKWLPEVYLSHDLRPEMTSKHLEGLTSSQTGRNLKTCYVFGVTNSYMVDHFIRIPSPYDIGHQIDNPNTTDQETKSQGKLWNQAEQMDHCRNQVSWELSNRMLGLLSLTWGMVLQRSKCSPNWFVESTERSWVQGTKVELLDYACTCSVWIVKIVKQKSHLNWGRGPNQRPKSATHTNCSEASIMRHKGMGSKMVVCHVADSIWTGYQVNMYNEKQFWWQVTAGDV